MARLAELPLTFIQNFLARNPNAHVDSNGYLASEYREEIARREAAALESSPEPRDGSLTVHHTDSSRFHATDRRPEVASQQLAA